MFLRQFIHTSEECLINLQQVRTILRTKNIITIEYVPITTGFFAHAPTSTFRWETEQEAIRVFDEYATQIRYGAAMEAANKLR